MPLRLYTDVHVHRAIPEQLRLREVDVLTVVEDQRRRDTDERLLERALFLQRVVYTQDTGFRFMAEEWQRIGRPFAGLIFGRRPHLVGRLVEDLELVAKASEPEEFRNFVLWIPL
jgi:hypothetical protein